MIRSDRHMDIMGHGRSYRPLVGRIPGGADRPVATTDRFPPLPSAVGVTVGVVDTGVVVGADGRPHPWFADHLAFRAQDVEPLGVANGTGGESRAVTPADGHGAFVAGLILHQAPRARVAMWGALDKGGAGVGDALGTGDDVAVADAVRALAHDPDVQVVNLSFGGGVFPDRGAAGNLEAALATLDPGVAVVAAAGNDGRSGKVWPAAFDRVIAVGATNESRGDDIGDPATTDDPPEPLSKDFPRRARFSNHGPWVRTYASGVRVLGPYLGFSAPAEEVSLLVPGLEQPFAGWTRWSGTSFAAASVSGRIAQTVIELRVSGVEAAEILLRESPTFDADGAVWVPVNP